MADHSKSGINTMFNTGTVVGVGSNIFGSDFPKKHIPSFSWGGSGVVATYPSHHHVIVSPPLVYVHSLEKLNESPALSFSGQNSHQNTKGAFTGESSPFMLKDAGCEYVILGHSERREYFHESDEILKEKIDSALEAQLKVIFCCGESLELRKSGEHFNHIELQIKKALFHLNEKQILDIVIAYEPIWAIGTGVTASSEEAEEMENYSLRKM